MFNHSQMQRGLHIDAASGMAGDMFLAALLDCGLNLDHLLAELKKLPIENFRLESSQVMRGAIRATYAKVFIRDSHGHERVEGYQEFHQHHYDSADHTHGRTYQEIIALIRAANFSPDVEARALAIFREIGVAEARVHGTSLEDVHFHEVGAVDSIVDICAAAIGVSLLGITRMTAGPIGVGTGVRRMAHGEVPLPAPATAEIVKGLPLRRTAVSNELLTPTGAAILKVMVDEFSPSDDLVIEETGYGAGSVDRADPPNVVRATLFRWGRPATTPQDASTVVVLETQVDDCTGETMGFARECLEAAGALDVLVQSVQMKKNRPGFLVTVIGHPQDSNKLEEILLTETTTFGVRRHMASRRILERESVTVETPIGGARMKLGILHGKVVQASPEYVDCMRLSSASGQSLQDVMSLVELTFRSHIDSSQRSR